MPAFDPPAIPGASAFLGLVALVAPVGALQTPPELVFSGDIGCVACAGERAFGEIRGLDVDPEGTIWVADRDAPVVRAFALRASPGQGEGILLRSFGRHGEGPGELESVNGLAVLSGRAVVLSDFGRRGLTRLELDGTPRPSLPVPAQAYGVTTDPTGRWVAWQIPRWDELAAGVQLASAEALVSSAEGRMRDVLVTTRGVLEGADGAPAAWALLSLAVAPDGRIAVGEGHRYRIVVRGPTGETEGVLTREVERTRRTPEEIEARREALRRGPAGAAGHPEADGGLPEVDPLRPHFAPGALRFDETGRLWVRTARGGPAATVFDLFGPRNAFIGEVRLPVAVGHFDVGGGLLAGVVTDPEYGVERVRWWQVVEPGSEGRLRGR